jgi:NTP pyrophosphatase (non-canonical NTP hydrolase)
MSTADVRQVFAGAGLSPRTDSLAKSVVNAPEATETVPDSTPYHFNGLTPGEAERLALLAEEAGEVVRAVGKILRHGYESFHPDKDGHLGNRRELESEIGDFAGVVDLMVDAGDINSDSLLAQAAAKRPRIMRYAHHQEGL